MTTTSNNTLKTTKHTFAFDEQTGELHIRCNSEDGQFALDGFDTARLLTWLVDCHSQTLYKITHPEQEELDDLADTPFTNHRPHGEASPYSGDYSEE